MEMNTFKKGISISENAWVNMNKLNVTIDTVFDIMFNYPAVNRNEPIYMNPRVWFTNGKHIVVVNEANNLVINVRITGVH